MIKHKRLGKFRITADIVKYVYLTVFILIVVGLWFLFPLLIWELNSFWWKFVSTATVAIALGVTTTAFICYLENTFLQR